MTRVFSRLVPVCLVLATIVASSGSFAAAEEKLALAEVAPPPASSGLDQAALKSAFEGELRLLQGVSLPNQRKVTVSAAITSTTDAPVACTVNALLRDGKTGTMIAIVQGRARSDGGANPELRKLVMQSAVRSAVNQIPEALGSKSSATASK
jgi:hypothetical protein